MTPVVKSKSTKPTQKNGYKHTKLGSIPMDWEIGRLGDICVNFKSGFGITSNHIKPIDEYPVYGGNGLRGFTNKYTHDGTYLLIGRQGALCGNIMVVHGKNYISEHAIAVQVNNENDISFLSYKLSFLNLNRYSESSAQPGLSVEKLVKLQIPFPPLSEQQKIACILNTWDKAIEKIEQLIVQKQQLKKGVMRQLLTGKVRFKEFRGSKWKKVKLDEVIDCYSGGTPSRTNPEYFNGLIPWIKSGELNQERIYATEEYISENALEESSAKLVRKETLLLALYGATAGVVAITEIEAAINQAILAILPHNEVDKTFLFYALKEVMPHNLMKLVQGGQPNLSASIVREITIKIPIDKREQHLISQFLAEFDRGLISNKKQLDKLRSQKKGLMQKLLSGQVRVKLN